MTLNIEKTLAEELSKLRLILAGPRGKQVWDIITALRGPDFPSERPNSGPDHAQLYKARVDRKMKTGAVVRGLTFPGQGGARYRTDRDFVELPPESTWDHYDKHIARACSALGIKIQIVGEPGQVVEAKLKLPPKPAPAVIGPAVADQTASNVPIPLKPTGSTWPSLTKLLNSHYVELSALPLAKQVPVVIGYIVKIYGPSTLKWPGGICALIKSYANMGINMVAELQAHGVKIGPNFTMTLQGAYAQSPKTGGGPVGGIIVPDTKNPGAGSAPGDHVVVK